MAEPRLDGQDISERDLRLGEELGRGGQGVVYQVTHPYPGLAYKKYIVSGAFPEALADLVELPARLTDRERSALLQQTCWPLARVTSEGRLAGFVMREIPGEFFGRVASGKRQLRELQYLIFEPKPLWGSIEPPATLDRLALARKYAALFQLMHAKGLVAGDVSMNNLLWTPGDPPRVMLLDCDGIRRLGSRPVLEQAETTDWNDPQQPQTGPDLDTDRYKLAMLVGRVLSRDAYVRPGDELRLPPELPGRVAAEVPALFQRAAGTHGSRPDTQQWAVALGGRDEIPLQQPQVRTSPRLPPAPVDDARPIRRWIPLPRRSTGQ